MGKSKRLAALTLTSAMLAGSVWTAPPAHAVVARITIAGIYYNSPGPDILDPIPFDPEDNASLNGEYIRLKNNSTTLSRNIGGFTIKDKAGNQYTLPYYIIGPGQSVKVRSGAGYIEPGTLHWTSFTGYVWDNDRDLAALRNASGTLADTCGYVNASVSFTLC